MKGLFTLLGLCAVLVSATRLVTPHGMDEYKGAIDRINEKGQVGLFAFTATWCGHCKAMKPRYIEAANKSPEEIVFVDVVCDEEGNEPICRQMNVRGYPTIMAFNGTWEEYDRGHDATDFMAFAEDLIEGGRAEFNDEYFPAPQVELEQDDFVEPIECVKGDRWVEMSYAKLEDDRNPKAVIFGDIRDEKSQKIYQILDKVIAEIGDKFPHKIVRVEKRREMNSDIFNYQSFKELPVIFFMTADSNGPQYYGGEHTYEALLEHLKELTSPVDYSKVIQVNSSQRIAEIVRETKKPAIVTFKASWCGHCKALAPIFARAAVKGQEYGNFIEVVCDKDNNQEICSAMKVQGYPTIKVFNGTGWTDYEGARAANSFFAALQAQHVEGDVVDDPIAAFAEAGKTDIEVEDVTEEEPVETTGSAKTGSTQTDAAEEIKAKVAEVKDKVVDTAGKVAGKVRSAINKVVHKTAEEEKEL